MYQSSKATNVRHTRNVLRSEPHHSDSARRSLRMPAACMVSKRFSSSCSRSTSSERGRSQFFSSQVWKFSFCVVMASRPHECCQSLNEWGADSHPLLSSLLKFYSPSLNAFVGPALDWPAYGCDPLKPHEARATSLN